MGAVAHGGALEGSGWAGASGEGPPALEARGSGLAARCAFMELLEAGSCCRPVCPRRFYRSLGKKERGGRRRFASGGGAQGPREATEALPDRTGRDPA